MSYPTRQAFVPKEPKEHTRDDRPFSIGYGRTIYQPLIVALMTDLAEIRTDHAVLEVGTGSDYQAAVLYRLASAVYPSKSWTNMGLIASTPWRSTIGLWNCSRGNSGLIPLKKPDLRRCFNFPVTAAYAKYASFLENFAPYISGFLSGIRF